ncbi:NfeD family protein [Isoalcanivorax beigongshangi]|uniref:NfeD family protein n=1 Tax=Isoalcanivorax beigongshangi TaxID=3238810 RepID=A0ABV4AGP5_9GAMM
MQEIEWMIPVYGWWFIFGFLLVISEFVIPGVIAVFFGFGALLVGVLVWAGVLNSFDMQVWTFALASIVILFGLRRRFKRWLKGNVIDRGQGGDMHSDTYGQRVAVMTDFDNGRGVVQLHGARWDAESEDALVAGDSAWVCGNHGIVLKVARQAPN